MIAAVPPFLQNVSRETICLFLLAGNGRAGSDWLRSGKDFVRIRGSFHQPLPFSDCISGILVPFVALYGFILSSEQRFVKASGAMLECHGKQVFCMKKMMAAVLSALLLISGCGSKEPSTSTIITSVDTTSDNDKILNMIQECISVYNGTNGNTVADKEKELNTVIAPLPVEISVLPDVSSLNDLTELKDEESTTNAVYIGSQTVNDKYSVVYKIYKPSSEFWINGQITFRANLDKVTSNDVQFAEYRAALDSLLSRRTDIQQWLVRLNVTVDETASPMEGYFLVTAMGDNHPQSIADVKAIAESVFTTDYLQYAYYPSAFEKDGSTFKEADGKLYCALSQAASVSAPVDYDTSLILAAADDNGTIHIDLLSQVAGQTDPDVLRIDMERTDAGYRFPSAY